MNDLLQELVERDLISQDTADELRALGITGNLPPLRGDARYIPALEKKRIHHFIGFVWVYLDEVDRKRGKPHYTPDEIKRMAATFFGEDRVIFWRKVGKNFMPEVYLDFGKRAAFKYLNPNLDIRLHKTQLEAPFVGKDANHAETMMALGLNY